MTVALAFDAGLAVLVLAAAGWTIAARETFAAVVGFAQARVCELLLLTGQLHSQLLYEHHHRGRDGQSEERAEDPHQRSARQEREQDDGRGKAQRPAIDPRNKHTAFELFVREHEDENDDGNDGATRQCREDHRPHREERADIGQHVREAGERRERQSVLHAARHQKPEREECHQQARDHLSSDIRADDRLEVHHDAREPDVVRAGDKGEEPPSEPIAVDHDVEPEEEGAQPVRDRAEDA